MLLGSLPIGEGHDVFEHDGKTLQADQCIEDRRCGGDALPAQHHARIDRRDHRQGLRPDSYDETRNGQLKRRVRFDWKQKKVELFDGETTQTVDLPDNTWDMASFGYNFAFAPSDEAEMDLFLTDGRRVSPYKFAVLGRERIDTELGSIGHGAREEGAAARRSACVRRVARAGSPLRAGADPLHREERHRVRLGSDQDQLLGSLGLLLTVEARRRRELAEET